MIISIGFESDQLHIMRSICEGIDLCAQRAPVNSIVWYAAVATAATQSPIVQQRHSFHFLNSISPSKSFAIHNNIIHFNLGTAINHVCRKNQPAVRVCSTVTLQCALGTSLLHSQSENSSFFFLPYPNPIHSFTNTEYTHIAVYAQCICRRNTNKTQEGQTKLRQAPMSRDRESGRVTQFFIVTHCVICDGN